MRYHTLLEELSARPLYLLAIFFLLLLVFHVLLVWWWKLDDVAWKRVDYVWLGAAVLGLLASSSQADRFLSKRYIESVERPRTETAYQVLRATLDGMPGVCAPRQRSAASPPDFDQIVQEQQALCKRGKEIAANMPARIVDAFPPLEKTGYEPFGQDARYETWFVREVSAAADQYRQQQQRYAELLEAGSPSGGELVFTVVGPLLLALALALRVTKVTGEIRNARSKRRD